MPWKMLFIVVCLLLPDAFTAAAAEHCTACHRVQLSGAHQRQSCSSCHGEAVADMPAVATAARRAPGCVSCHRGYGQLFAGVMTTGATEAAFIRRSYGKLDPQFREKNCSGCHVTSCLDCHGGNGHQLARPAVTECLSCHKGYFTGFDYLGMAPREDHQRYQRGEKISGETYLKMLPDVHAERGMTCGACHSMASLAAGRKSSKTCRDCHTANPRIIEHRIGAHLEKLECYACHSAWTAQEYGTFFIRFQDSRSRDSYDLSHSSDEYVRSAYLKRQDAPPLGINRRGLVSPIRPEFIAYFSSVRRDQPVGVENQLLAAEWKAYFPHTTRRGTVMCEGCHDSPRRFLLEKPAERIYRLQEDGMTLGSFWDQDQQKVVNGAFFDAVRYQGMSTRGNSYKRAYLEKWKTFVNHVDGSSRH